MCNRYTIPDLAPIVNSSIRTYCNILSYFTIFHYYEAGQNRKWNLDYSVNAPPCQLHFCNLPGLSQRLEIRLLSSAKFPNHISSFLQSHYNEYILFGTIPRLLIFSTSLSLYDAIKIASYVNSFKSSNA